MGIDVTSPLTGSTRTEQVGSVSTAEIVSIYDRYFGIDISAYFAGLDEVRIIRCLDSGYMFYHPLTLEGDESYYELMSQFDWYYHPNRWEHGRALELIESGTRVLEVGSGAGLFVKQLLDKGINAEGLELNGRGIETARKTGVHLRKETIQSHAENHPEEYDVVCSFQVLEHIAEPLSFLNAMLKCLKPDGKLILGVPNNDSYIKENRMDNKVLNMPPHHMGLWTLESLSALEELIGVKLLEVHYEPLVDGNVTAYLWNKVNRVLLGNTLLTNAVFRLKVDRLFVPVLDQLSDRIRGNSMLAVFTRG